MGFHLPHFPLTFRWIVAISIILSFLMCNLIWRNSKDKKEYEHIKGKITYLGQRLGNLPVRNLGAYRYLKIDNYSYPFEIYTNEQSYRMDSLKKGDNVTAYFYQTEDTESEKINRFLQYLEKDGKLYYKRSNVAVLTGVILILTLLILSIACYFLYKKGKIPY